MNTPHARALRIAIVNDYPIVVAGIATVLSVFPDRVEVVELDAATPVRAEVDIVILDAFARTRTRSAFSIEDHVNNHTAKIVVFSWVTDPQAIQDALEQGAAAYLPKSLDAEQFVTALEAVHAGERLIGLSLPGLAPTDETTGTDWPGRDEGLSQRESEVIALLAQGLTNLEIAHALYLSDNTVKTHIRTAYRKMSVHRRSQAVLWAIDHGFTTAPQRTMLSSPTDTR